MGVPCNAPSIPVCAAQLSLLCVAARAQALAYVSMEGGRTVEHCRQLAHMRKTARKCISCGRGGRDCSFWGLRVGMGKLHGRRTSNTTTKQYARTRTTTCLRIITHTRAGALISACAKRRYHSGYLRSTKPSADSSNVHSALGLEKIRSLLRISPLCCQLLEEHKLGLSPPPGPTRVVIVRKAVTDVISSPWCRRARCRRSSV